MKVSISLSGCEICIYYTRILILVLGAYIFFFKYYKNYYMNIRL